MKQLIYILSLISLFALFITCKKKSDGAEIKEIFKVYNSTNSPLIDITTGGLTCMKIDKCNDVWIGTKSSNYLLKYSLSTDKWKVFGSEFFGSEIWSVLDLDIDKDDNIWIATNDGVFQYDRNKFVLSLKDNSIPHSSWVSKIHVDQSDNVWCCLNGELYKNECDSWTKVIEFNNLFPKYQIQSITSINDEIWIGCFQGLIKYDGLNFSQIEHQPEINMMNIFSIEIISSDNLWIGANGGLYNLLDLKWNSYDSISFINPLWDSQDWIVSAIERNGLNMLFGTWNTGLSEYDGQHFSFKRGSEFGIDTNDFQINELEYDLKNNLWIATRFGEIIVYNKDGL